jgi:pilus assembly protein CpaE
MKPTTNILIAGHSTSELEQLRNRVGQLPNVNIRLRMLGSASYEFGGDADFKPDILVLLLGLRPEADLAGLAGLPPPLRPITLIVDGDAVADHQLMRLSMQAGVRDFIMGPQVIEDTLAAIQKVLREELAANRDSARGLTAVVNAKGGAGASTIASALAHAFASRHGLRTLLLDLDFQFGCQCLNLDLHPQQGLMEALAAVDSLDEVALTGYVAQHASGLHVLGCLLDQVILPGEVDEARLSRLLELIHRGYGRVVVDLPRLIDPVFYLILEKAEHVIVVLQQDLTNLRDAQRLAGIMMRDLGIAVERVHLVINRYNGKRPITPDYVQGSLGLGAAALIPNDFANLHKAADLGVAIADHAPHSPATRSIQKLAATLVGKHGPKPRGLLQTLFSRLLPGG